MSDQTPLHPFINRFFPDEERIIPSHSVNADEWVIEPHKLFNTQWIQCSYPISGTYGAVSRYMFYCLALLAVLGRRTAWVVFASLGLVMTYSAAAAIHALVLVALRTKIAPKYVLDNYEIVLVKGPSNGTYYNSDVDAVWLPVLPMAWDNDGDPVLAIVGSAFLTLLPMQIWSSTFKKSRAKTMLVLWSGLLLIGTVCALINVFYVNTWAFPQLRFCPPGLNDTMPFSNGRSDLIGGTWDRVDWYRWNRTITEYFENPSVHHSTVCVYPCFETSWPLRDPSEINVVIGSTGTDGESAWWYLFAVYLVVCSSGVSSLTVFAMKIFENPPQRIRRSALLLQSKIQKIWNPFLDSMKIITAKVASALGVKLRTHQFLQSFWTCVKPGMKQVFRFGWHCFKGLVYIYARIVSPIALVLFVSWIEWYMWKNDPPGESIRHVGQWGALVAAGLVLLAAVVDYCFDTPVGASEEDEAEMVPL